MKPSLSDLLTGSALRLIGHVVPALEANPYARGDTATIMLIGLLAAEESEKSADLAKRDAAGLRAVFDAAGDPATDIPFAENLLVSQLEAEADALRARLTPLLEKLEAENSPAARALEARIFRHLAEIAAARDLTIPRLG